MLKLFYFAILVIYIFFVDNKKGERIILFNKGFVIIKKGENVRFS